MIYTKNNPSKEYIQLIKDYETIHKKGTANQKPEDTYNGISTIKFAEIIKKIIKKNNCFSLLDYGSGKGSRYFNNSVREDGKKFPPLKEYWKIEPTFYDPGVPYPKPINSLFDIVICIDVLEHIPYQDLGWVMNEIFEFSKDIVFLNVACYTSSATLPNGKNAHVSLFDPLWWSGFIEAIASRYDKKVFLICTYIENKDDKKHKYFSYSVNLDLNEYN